MQTSFKPLKKPISMLKNITKYVLSRNKKISSDTKKVFRNSVFNKIKKLEQNSDWNEENVKPEALNHIFDSVCNNQDISSDNQISNIKKNIFDIFYK